MSTSTSSPLDSCVAELNAVLGDRNKSLTTVRRVLARALADIVAACKTLPRVGVEEVLEREEVGGQEDKDRGCQCPKQVLVTA
jgi:hypothetical protein